MADYEKPVEYICVDYDIILECGDDEAKACTFCMSEAAALVCYTNGRWDYTIPSERIFV